MSKNPTKIIGEPGKQELFVFREFDAPRELVFKAFTDPKILIQWLGPKNLTMKIEKYDVKNGGSWRYVYADSDGNQFGFHGVFHDITEPERAIQTFEFEFNPVKGRPSLDSATFETLPGNRTRLTIQSVYFSVMDRDGMLQNMEKGVTEGYERLDELLAKDNALT